MDIKEIAIQTWAEVSKSTSVGPSIAVAFAEALLAKLAQQEAKPVAIATRNVHGTLGLQWHESIPHGTKLYTEAQYIAGQQKAAEACAKVGKDEMDNYYHGDEGRIAAENIAEAICNGEWRNYQ